MFGLRKKTEVVEDQLRMARSYFGIATHLRRNNHQEALCGCDLLDDDNKRILTDEDVEELVLHKQHSNFFLCGGCVSLVLDDFSEEEVYALRK